ncbi:MAG: right-handed parallel beta-helix repeat-containing protein [Planctomycetia bacterium]|nr:right-handed parallel beta-helix repeat-containing protein [Planctomycetia bacterium]
MRFRPLAMLCGLLLGFADAASARQLYISNIAGDDQADGTSPESTVNGGPVRTIGRAIQLARPGDLLVVANTGIAYRESLSLSSADQSGSAVQPFTILGNGAVLDGTLPIPVKAWEAVRGDLYRFHPPQGGWHQLFFADGKPVAKIPVEAASGKLPTLAPGQWCSHDGYIYFRLEPSKIPHDYTLYYAALPVGITLYHVHDVRIVDLTIQGFRRDGVNVNDGVRNARLGGLILRGNGRAGLVVGGSSQVEADGCLLGNNGSAQTIVDGYSTLSLKQCELLENPAPPIVRTGGHNRLFVNGEMKP